MAKTIKRRERMKKAVSILLMVLLVASTPALAKKIENVEVADAITLGGQNLVLNGAGLREKKVAFIPIKVYAAGLYLTAKNADAQTIMDADTPMVIRLYITTGMATKSKLTDAWNEGFERATSGNTASIKSEIDKFNALFKVNPKEGDMYEIAYIPGKGISLALNGASQGDTIPGLAFKKAVFGIWLSKTDDKFLNELKAGLLGK
jgi:hypothetical protein